MSCAFVTRLILVAGLLATLASLSLAADNPDCGTWPTNMALTYLRNAGLVKNEAVDHEKTSARRLASEKIGPDLYRQVYLVTIVEKSGPRTEAITVSDASHEECSMSGVQVFVVARRLGDPVP